MLIKAYDKDGALWFINTYNIKIEKHTFIFNYDSRNGMNSKYVGTAKIKIQDTTLFYKCIDILFETEKLDLADYEGIYIEFQ